MAARRLALAAAMLMGAFATAAYFSSVARLGDPEHEDTIAGGGGGEADATGATFGWRRAQGHLKALASLGPRALGSAANERHAPMYLVNALEAIQVNRSKNGGVGNSKDTFSFDRRLVFPLEGTDENSILRAQWLDMNSLTRFCLELVFVVAQGHDTLSVCLPHSGGLRLFYRPKRRRMGAPWRSKCSGRAARFTRRSWGGSRRFTAT